jgi:osmotically-inducible protein OsmY
MQMTWIFLSQIQKAEQLARNIDGVKDVRNDVQVKPQS